MEITLTAPIYVAKPNDLAVLTEKWNLVKEGKAQTVLLTGAFGGGKRAIVAEVALWNLWAGKLKDPQVVRGGRINAAGKIPYPPRGWPREKKKPAKEENEQSAASVA